MRIFPTWKEFFFDMLTILAIFIILVAGFWFYMIRMPNVSFHGLTPPLTEVETKLLNNLKSHVTFLAHDWRGRNYYLDNSLAPFKDYIINQFHSYGYQVALQEYQPYREIYAHIGEQLLSQYQNLDETYANIEVEITGTHKPEEIIIIGAHYDTVPGSPGANDNASGVAAILEIARLLHGQSLSRTVRLVSFVNEEPPFFQSKAMGSYVYAKRCAEKGENIVGMMALETIGYFSDEPNSQKYPPPFSFFYPNQANFIGFVGNLSSRQLVKTSIDIFRQHATIPSEGAAIPAFIPGVDWSDHWAFWQQNYPGLMITDTAPYRYPYYHESEDTPDKIDYDKMTQVVSGIQKVVEGLANVGWVEQSETHLTLRFFQKK
jgi:hypothetical protein